ncbi:MAG: hypothetical protein AB7U62_04125 [Pseudolabrys sp.]
MRPETASALKVAYNPFLDRAALTDKQAILAQMADDFRIIATNAGGVDREHLELVGWLPAQIERYGKDAARLARQNADRSHDATPETRKNFRVSRRQQ